jgi:alkanesulfonate monooxygenase SsuD/methylene tetrahydromethanopterin reductase-like flavin-dependent oxidoreductase (luciferase family)
MGDYGRQLEFGHFLVPNADAPLLETARAADRAGLDLIGVQDHPYQRRYVDTWTLLSMIAAGTERVRVFPDVANLPLRPPAVLAKAAASLDVLSGGRAELGLGAGGFSEAIEAFGGPSRTHLNLHDSNVDWGQDLGRLAEHLRKRYPGQPVWLIYKGAGVPAAYGITAQDPLSVPASRVHGLLVVSDSSVAKATGPLAHLLATSGAPIDEVGHSITIYRRP